MKYTADFETTTEIDDCRVWAWGVCDIEYTEYFKYGNTLDGFMEFVKDGCKYSNDIYYFHNLKFDGEFIIKWLFDNGYKHITKKEDEADKTFTTLISDKGVWYSIRIIFKKWQKKRARAVTIYDSMKLLPFSVDAVAKAYDLPISKLKIDYKEFREFGHKLTDEEVQYLNHDVKIMALALQYLFSQGLDKMTIGSNAMSDYKSRIGSKQFERLFPIPYYDKEVRQSYKGAFTYCNPLYASQDCGTTLVFDVNSLYPWVMHDCPLPYGEPIAFNGQYEEDALYPLYVQILTCHFELKENMLPTIQIKGNCNFIPTQYLENSLDKDGNEQEVTLYLTNVDLKLFFEHYDVEVLNFHGGYKWKQAVGMFNVYIDYWVEKKIEADKQGNSSLRLLSKLFLNNLYGKFATNPIARSKIPYLDENGIVKMMLGEEEERKPIYIAVGSFITAYAREKTIRSAQKMIKYFRYADTDSLHLEMEVPQELLNLSGKQLAQLTNEDFKKYGIDFPSDFEIDGYKLGAWKCENIASRSRFIRAKTYIEDNNPKEVWNNEEFNSKDLKEYCEEKQIDFESELDKYKGYYDKAKLKITCAGMPKGCYPFVNWKNFYMGMRYKGKLTPKHCVGGIVLVDTDFTIKIC